VTPRGGSVPPAGTWPLHTRSQGDGTPDVVCIHGVGVSGRYFAPFMSAMTAASVRSRPSPRLHAVDLPGFGCSDGPRDPLDTAELADALAGWIERTGLDAPVLLGNSFGCQVVAHLAAARPSATRAVVLVGPTVDAAARSHATQVARFLRNAVHESPRQLPLLIRDYADAGPRLVLASFRAAVRDRLEDRLPHVAAPTLVVRGAQDRIVSQAWAEEVTRRLPRGRLFVVPEAAHTVHFTHPRQLAVAVRSFLADLAVEETP
jgi:pimeloyl-ACP methyl ester carboxylesterase